MPVAGAIKPCAVADRRINDPSSSSEHMPLSTPLKIVMNFKGNLRRLMPCDAQRFFSLHRNLPLHFEVFALLLKEPWIVDMMSEECAQFVSDSSDRHRMVAEQFGSEGLETKESFRRIANELLTKAVERKLQPTEEMMQETYILHEQHGLVRFGGIMTFKRLGMVVGYPPSKNSFKWRKLTYYRTGNDDVLDKFADELLKFSADHF